ncbi:MAG TPA: hypothetical protein VM241_01235 [Candidatus Thermoplasmatota archaeon]|nr:hypothetical protein [Candidatus Thermoplasmatota archaeon]
MDSNLSAAVNLYPDNLGSPTIWQTPKLRFPAIQLERRDPGWRLSLNHLVRLDGPTPQSLLQQLHERHAIRATLVQPRPAAS